MFYGHRRVAALSLSAVILVAAGCDGAADRKDKYLSRGDQYFAEQNYDKARVEYSNALQIDPKNAKGRYFLGQIAERTTKYREALEDYLAAAEDDPTYLQARAAAARVYLFGGMKDKATETLEPGFKVAPGDADLLTVRGAIRSQDGDDAGALADAQQAVKAAPTNELALALLASVYRKTGRFDEGIAALKGGVEKLPNNVDLRVILADLQMSAGHVKEAQALLEEIIRIDPRNLAHRQRLARFHLLNKDPVAAEAVMRDAVKAVPDSVETKLSLAELIGQQHGVDQAEAQMLEYIAKEPANPELKLMLAHFYEGTGKVDKAVAQYQQVITAEGLKPKALMARDRLAGLAAAKGDTAHAQQLIAEVLGASPRDSEALAMRGQLALNNGDPSAAITDLRSVLRDEPNAVQVMRVLARAYMQNNDAALAEESLRNAIQVNPKDVGTRMDLVSLLVQSGRIDQARTLLEQLILDAPSQLEVRDAYFRVQLAQSDFAGARRTAADIRLLRPELPLGMMLSGEVDEREKKYDAAAANYEAAGKISPDSAEVLAGLVRIDLAQKQGKRALARLSSAIEKNADNAMALNLQGEVNFSMGDYDAAIKSFDTLIQRAPTAWLPYRGKAGAEVAAKRTDAALATLTQGFERTGGALALAEPLAAMHLHLGHTDAAILVYEDVLKRNPRAVPAANNLAMLLVTYRTDKASLDRAAQLADSLGVAAEPSLLDTRGWVKFKRGEYLQAVTLLQQAADKAPAAAEIHYHLGMAQYKSGNAAAARGNLEMALKSGATFSGADEARSVLNSASPAS